MPYQIHTGSIETVGDKLNGAAIFNPIPTIELPLGGKTLIFSTPAVTVTFAGSAGALFTLQAAITAINAALSATIAFARGADYGPNTTSRIGDGKLIARQRLGIQRDAGFTIDKTGTSNSILNIPTDADTVGAPIAAAKVIGFSMGPQMGQLAILIAP